MTIAIKPSGLPDTDHDVIIIGTGFAGLGMAMRLKQDGQSNFLLLEKASEVGGTWLINQYPGCACDVESHLYSFSFAQNPSWSRRFASQPEILAYLKRCADEYGIRPHIRFGQTVEKAQWQESKQRWQVTVASGERFQCKTLVSAIGGLSRPVYPDIAGLDSFEGECFHSQNWNHDYDLNGKRVAVIGTGASAIQFVPQIARKVKNLQLFQRTAPWVMPKPDRPISRAEQKLLKRFPALQSARRNSIYWRLEARAAAFVLHPKILRAVQGLASRHLRKQVPDKRLRAKLTPDYTMGCKRVLISNDYYPALSRSNVEVNTNGIAEIRANSIVDQSGREHPVDAILFGTGFAATDPVGPLTILGRDGEDLRDAFKTSGTEAYRGTTVAGFPNLFLLCGPNTGLGHNSMVYMIESQINYTIDALSKMKRHKVTAVEPTPVAQHNYNADLQERHKNTIWSVGGCKSWYQDANGKNVTLWPGFTWQFRQQTKRFDLSAYRHEAVKSTEVGSVTVE